MKVAVVLTAALVWHSLVNAGGTLLQKELSEVHEGPRGFFPAPFFPPFHPTYSPGVYPPFNAPPECFPKPVTPDGIVTEPVDCPVCPATESCTCEPVLQACQTYTITVCPSAPPAPQIAVETQPVVEEVIDEKIVDVATGDVISEKQEAVDVTPEFIHNPAIFGPLGGFTAFPGFNPLVSGIYPYGGYPSQFSTRHESLISALRSLGDDEGETNSDTAEHT